MKTIAVIDDDVYIGDMLCELLAKEGFAVVRAYSGTEALYLLQERKPDLVLLDLMLPGLNGEDVLKRIESCPVIVLSAKADIESKVELLLDGAADYMTKPFNTRELLARIQVQLRNTEKQGTGSRLFAGGMTLDTDAFTVTAGGAEIKLTRTEGAILKLLMVNHGRVVSKNTILDRIAADTPDCTERSLKQHISNLRRKLIDAAGRDPVETVWGIGFKLTEEQ